MFTFVQKAFRALRPLAVVAAFAAPIGAEEVPDLQLFFQAASVDKAESEAALSQIAQGWKDGYTPLLVDLARFFPSSRRQSGGGPSSDDFFTRDAPPGSDPAPGDQPFGNSPDTLGRPSAPTRLSPRAQVRARLVRFLEKQTGEGFGDDLSRWRKWMWNRPYEPHPDYAVFKGVLYREVDQRMAQFFPPGAPAMIRLDEVDWGGVGVNGIPPLDHPRHISASEADYLDSNNIIFGIEIDGDARAYPKRILAWHEMALDEVGGTELTIVYCTLCGTVIPYGAEVGGEHRSFGTSGLLYRSNKLMFDEETMSLWSTVEGRPVLGELAGEDLELEAYPVVTTTWKEWLALHPDTEVLSIDTGFERDYSEGTAYRAYFRTDRLMFGIPERDKRLKNKDEVLALLMRPQGAPPEAERKALALSAKFLKKNRLHHYSFAGYNLVVITSKKGANRVYDVAGRRFVEQAKDGSLQDGEGTLWTLTEEALVSQSTPSTTLPRVPARRAFWFGWHAQFPDTELVR